jgi:hypothetical protein
VATGSPTCPTSTSRTTGDWDLDEARRLAREAVAFALDADRLPEHVRIVERMPARREAR